MKTSQNIAIVSAKLIRAAARDIRRSTHGYAEDATHANHNKRHNALESLDAIAAELDQYAASFDSQTAGQTVAPGGAAAV